MTKTKKMVPDRSQLLLYQSPSGEIKIDVRLEEETVWLTQVHMAELFGKARSTINEHIKKIFAEGELFASEVMRRFGNSEFFTKPTKKIPSTATCKFD